jgi:hypothetical protein
MMWSKSCSASSNSSHRQLKNERGIDTSCMIMDERAVSFDVKACGEDGLDLVEKVSDFTGSLDEFLVYHT